MKGGLIFLVLMITIAINLEDNMISRLGFEPTFLKITLVAVVITGLVMHRGLALVVLVLFLSVEANMPDGFMLNFGLLNSEAREPRAEDPVSASPSRLANLSYR